MGGRQDDTPVSVFTAMIHADDRPLTIMWPTVILVIKCCVLNQLFSRDLLMASYLDQLLGNHFAASTFLCAMIFSFNVTNRSRLLF